MVAETSYGAKFLQDALAHFVIKYRNPTLTPLQVKHAARDIHFQFNHFPVYHQIKFILEDAQHLSIMEGIRDAAHTRPAWKDRQGRQVPAWFDTVLVNEGTGGPTGVEGM